MLYQEIAVAEAPEHRDTRQPAVTRRQDIDIAVAHIDGSLLPYSQLPQRLNDGVGAGFFRMPAASFSPMATSIVSGKKC